MEALVILKEVCGTLALVNTAHITNTTETHAPSKERKAPRSEMKMMDRCTKIFLTKSEPIYVHETPEDIQNKAIEAILRSQEAKVINLAPPADERNPFGNRPMFPTYKGPGIPVGGIETPSVREFVANAHIHPSMAEALAPFDIGAAVVTPEERELQSLIARKEAGEKLTVEEHLTILRLNKPATEHELLIASESRLRLDCPNYDLPACIHIDSIERVKGKDGDASATVVLKDTVRWHSKQEVEVKHNPLDVRNAWAIGLRNKVQAEMDDGVPPRPEGDGHWVLKHMPSLQGKHEFMSVHKQCLCRDDFTANPWIPHENPCPYGNKRWCKVTREEYAGKRPGQVICGFPGVGKSTVCKPGKEICGKTVYDSDSSDFKWAPMREGDEPEVDPAWPYNYIQHIQHVLDEGDIILCSTHHEVREALKEHDIDYVRVFPYTNEKAEWIARLEKRGRHDDPKICELLYTHWDQWIQDLEEEGGLNVRIPHDGYLNAETVAEILACTGKKKRGFEADGL